jgi:hypothetical protein
VVTLVNTSVSQPRSVVVQAGAYAEHQFESVECNGQTSRVNDRAFTVKLAPGAGARLTITMRRYVNQPTVAFPWDR